MQGLMELHSLQVFLTVATEKSFSRAAVCVVSSQEKLDAANKELGDGRLDVEEILRSAD